MDKTLGAYLVFACQKALDEANVMLDQIDGVICCDSHIAGSSGGSGPTDIMDKPSHRSL